MKRKILLISLEMLLGSLITVGATILIQSNQVLYKNDKTVEEAINDLYAKSNIGDALASDIKAGKKALVGGNVTFEFGNNYRTNGYLYWFAK